MSDLETYLDVLFEGLDGYVYSPVKTTDNWEQNWFSYPAQRQELVEHIETCVGDVYISPAVYSERRATKDAIKKVQTTWVEFDGNEQIHFQSAPLPTLIVQTSFQSHVHCYWRIDPTNRTTVEDTNRRLTHYLQADSSGWDATQLLRPPGTINHKRELPVILINHEKVQYHLDSFESVPKVLERQQKMLLVLI